MNHQVSTSQITFEMTLAGLHFFAASDGREISQFLVREKPRADNKTQTQGNFQRKAGASALGDIERELGVLPILELVEIHKKVATVHLAEPDVAAADAKFAFFKAHGLRTIAATTALMEHQLAVLGAKLVNNFLRFFGR